MIELFIQGVNNIFLKPWLSQINRDSFSKNKAFYNSNNILKVIIKVYFSKQARHLF